tara:strand:+ start:198 stop:893 length:696 start_codon:yes stop_codon:yes gene_type:complete
MPTIYAATTDNDIYGPNTSWASARGDDGTYSTLGNASGTYESYGAGAFKFASRGGGSNYRVHRSFFHFDTSGITDTLSAGTLKIYFESDVGDANIIVVKSDAFTGGSDVLVAADFNNLDFSTAYSSEVDTTATGLKSITLNAAALADIKDNDDFKFAIINYDYDKLNTAPSSTVYNYVRIYYSDYTGTTRDPQIDYTVVTGYANHVTGVATGNIGKVNGIATASIEKVIGV